MIDSPSKNKSKFPLKENSKSPRKLVKIDRVLENSYLDYILLISILGFWLVHSSNCINLKPNEDKPLKKFNLALMNFINDWKLKNADLNLSEINIINPEKLRNKREITLEEELELMIKNRNSDTSSQNIERTQKSIKRLNEFNSIEKRLEQNQEKTCISCQPSDDLKRIRIEQIRNEILHKLNLKEPPTVDLSPDQKKIILNNFLKKNPNYQSDQSPDDYEADDEEMLIREIVTFAEKAPARLKLDDNIQYFNLSKNFPNLELIDAELNFKIKTTSEFDSLNNTANIAVYRIERTYKGNDEPFLVTTARVNVLGSSAWISIDIKQLMKFWIQHPNKNYGLFIHCNNSLGKIFEQPYLNDPESSTFIRTSHRALRRTRNKRSKRMQNDCPSDSKKNLCCRSPLEINFEEIGFDFIAAPRSFNAYFCSGKCTYANSNLQNHTTLMFHMNKSTSVCCGGRKFSSISVLYMENKQLIASDFQNMVVDRCGCS